MVLPIVGIWYKWNHATWSFVTDFFHLASCFQSLSLLRQVSVLRCFSWPYNNPLWRGHSLSVHSSADGHLGCFHFGGCYELMLLWTLVYRFLGGHVFSSLGCIPGWDRRKDFPPSKATLTLMVMPLRSLPHPGAFPEPCCVSGPLKGLLAPVRTSISGPGFLAWFPILRGKKGTDCSISSPGFLSPFCWIHHLMQPCYGPCAAGRTWTWSHAGLSLNPGFATCWQITVALGKSYNRSSAQLVHL